VAAFTCYDPMRISQEFADMNFLVDLALAWVPAVGAYTLHGWMAAVAVYVLALSILRVIDKLAVEKRLGLLWRLAIKVVIIIAAQGLVSISVTSRRAFF
jgi:hypothetical protein